MSRLIEADDIPYVTDETYFHEYDYAYRYAIDALPTVDAVPVIRCCDCIHFEYFEDQFTQMTRCDVHDRCPDYTDYCSWAERREE